MKKFEGYLDIHKLPVHTQKIIGEFAKELNTLDIDDAQRVVSVILSNLIERDYTKQGKKFVEEANNKNKILFDDWGHYKWDTGDHSGYILENQKVIQCTMEPYYIWKENLRKLIEWADRDKLDFYIDGRSPHFPGRTVMIHIPVDNKYK